LPATSQSDPSTSRRALNKERRRQQLINATIKCISNKGLGSTTLADVAKEAGLSQGIVNLHFDSKDNLLAETLRYLAEEYDEHFMRVFEKQPDDAATRLLALMEMDLKPPVCDRQKLAVWFSFWGEVKAVPTYQKICAARDEKYDAVMRELAEAVIDDGGYDSLDAQAVVDVLSSMTDGMWLSYLVNPRSFDSKAARRAVRSYLAAIFPRHFSQE